MVSIPKTIGVVSCGFLLCLGLSNAAQADNAASSADKLKAANDWSKAEIKAAEDARKAHETYLEKVEVIYKKAGEAVKAHAATEDLATSKIITLDEVHKVYYSNISLYLTIHY